MSRTPNFEARENILKAAFALIHERGFKGVSMDDIASASGIKKANLFHYYPSKEALGLAVFDRASSKMREKVEGQFAKGKDPIRLVEAMFSEVMGADDRRNGCFMGKLAHELGDRYESLRLKVAEHFRCWEDQLAAVLEDGRCCGYFRKDLKPKESAEAILSLFEGATLFCKTTRETKPLANAKDMAVGYLKGFKK